MPPRQPIPDHLRADTFGPSTVGFGRNRLRSPDLLHPHHGARIVRGGPLDPALLPPDDALRAGARSLCAGAAPPTWTASLRPACGPFRHQAYRRSTSRSTSVPSFPTGRPDDPLIRPGAESRPETLLRLQLVSAGLPEPAVNQDIRTTAGHFIARGDLVLETWRVLVEYDGDHHRVDRAQWDHDITRQERLVAEGWTVVRVTAQALFADPTSVTRRVRTALLAAGWHSHRS